MPKLVISLGLTIIRGMKRLFIVRHAKSSWDSPYLSDFERPLNKRGKRDLPDMTQRFFETHYRPELIISSPANRALTTAKAYAKTLSISGDQFLTNENLYHASTSTIKHILSGVEDDCNCVMIFGHNPGLTSLIYDLSGFNLYNLPTSGICGIEFPFDSWKEIINTKGEKIYYDFPKSRA